MDFSTFVWHKMLKLVPHLGGTLLFMVLSILSNANFIVLLLLNFVKFANKFPLEANLVSQFIGKTVAKRTLVKL